MEKLRINMPILVEGKYDKIALSSLVDAHILTTDGFSLFRKSEKQALLRRLAEQNGILVLTDPDGAGRVIRGFLSGILPREKVTHLYIPAIEGKEKRKDRRSRAGLLGVEGIDAETLRKILAPYAADAEKRETGAPITKADFYECGLSGVPNAEEKRVSLARRLSFPPDMSANALLTALNLLYTREEFFTLVQNETNTGEQE